VDSRFFTPVETLETESQFPPNPSKLQVYLFGANLNKNIETKFLYNNVLVHAYEKIILYFVMGDLH
jgi:hypothetical protein